MACYYIRWNSRASDIKPSSKARVNNLLQNNYIELTEYDLLNQAKIEYDRLFSECNAPPI